MILYRCRSLIWYNSTDIELDVIKLIISFIADLEALLVTVKTQTNYKGLLIAHQHLLE